MKQSITIDFLRGIFFAYVAYSCYLFGNALWIGLVPRFQLIQAGSSALLLGVYLVLFIGLLFRPARSAKAVFIFLALFCLLPIVSGLYWLNYPLSALPRSPFTMRFFVSLFTSVTVAAIAYVHYRAR
ncbi:MAG: hypothetical protein QOH24_2210 [Verrucomicrobiota bacterium]|jgi:cytochrome b subunit of formate dehydrogenase